MKAVSKQNAAKEQPSKEDIMELIFIAALIAACIYTGLWKLILPLCLALYAAFLIARFRERWAEKAQKASRARAVTFTTPTASGAFGSTRPTR